MDWLFILTVSATLIGVIAGVVQVLQYFYERKNNRDVNFRQSVQLQPSSKIKIKYNLPHPDYKRYIGRGQEIENIISILCHNALSETDIVTIKGVGGVGKSALAIEIAYRLYRDYKKIPRDGRFDAIIWTSARTNIYTTDKIISYAPPEKVLDLVYVNIATTLARPDVIKLNRIEQHEAIRNLLTMQRTLLLIDNVDRFDDEFLAFLQNVPEPTKIIITARNPVSLDYTVQLTGLNLRDAQELIRSESTRRNTQLSISQASELHKKTLGLPLVIVLAIAQIAEGYNVQNILNLLGKQSDDIARHCFENTLEHIRDTNAWKVLLALSMFPSGTKEDVLGLITELSIAQLDMELIKLNKLSLVNQTTPGKFWMLPLIVDYVQSELANLPKPVVSKLKHNFAKAYMNIKIESAFATEGYIHAVHLAIDLSDLQVWDDKIASFMAANQKAIERGVKITRIFVLDKNLTYLDHANSSLHPEICRILDDQLNIHIDVYILWRESIVENNITVPLDMIIFDGNEIHLHKGHGGWYPDVNISKDPDEINYWENNIVCG